MWEVTFLENSQKMIGLSARRLCEQEGIPPVYIALGAAGALHRFLIEEKIEGGEIAAQNKLSELSGLSSQSELGQLILSFYRLFNEGLSLTELHHFAKSLKHKLTGKVI